MSRPLLRRRCCGKRGHGSGRSENSGSAEGDHHRQRHTPESQRAARLHIDMIINVIPWKSESGDMARDVSTRKQSAEKAASSQTPWDISSWSFFSLCRPCSVFTPPCLVDRHPLLTPPSLMCCPAVVASHCHRLVVTQVCSTPAHDGFLFCQQHTVCNSAASLPVAVSSLSPRRV